MQGFDAGVEPQRHFQCEDGDRAQLGSVDRILASEARCGANPIRLATGRPASRSMQLSLPPPGKSTTRSGSFARRATSATNSPIPAEEPLHQSIGVETPTQSSTRQASTGSSAAASRIRA